MILKASLWGRFLLWIKTTPKTPQVTESISSLRTHRSVVVDSAREEGGKSGADGGWGQRGLEVLCVADSRVLYSGSQSFFFFFFFFFGYIHANGSS